MQSKRGKDVAGVAFVYLAAAWVFIQVASTIVPILGWPDWTLKLLLVVCALGFPVALILSWFFDLTPAGIRRADGAAGPQRTGGLIAFGAGGVLLLISGGWWVGQRTGLLAGRLDSVAVLPFENLSRDPDQEYFVAGMQDALITQLAQISALRVISRTSTLPFAHTAKPISEIARTLDVSAIVEGSVWKAGDSVRIQVQLIRTRPREKHLWARSFDRDVGKVLSMQSEVVKDIAEEVRATLTADEKARIEVARVVNPQAYEALLKARLANQEGTPAGARKALNYVTYSLRLDSTYAPAHIVLSGVYAAFAQYGVMPADSAFAMALPHIRKALELDSTLYVVHQQLANMHRRNLDFAAAEREYRRAFKAGPNDANLNDDYALLLAARGKFRRAARYSQRALELDPLTPRRYFFHGIVLKFMHDDQAALRYFRQTLALSPDHAGAHFQLWQTYYRLGDTAAAFKEAQLYFQVLNRDDVVDAMRRAFSQAGYRAAMHAGAEQLARDVQQQRARPTVVAALYHHAGEYSKLLDWLYRGVEMHDPDSFVIPVADYATAVRDSPRFHELIRRMGVER